MIIFAAGVASAIMMLAGIGLMVYMLMRKAHLEKVEQQRSRVVVDAKMLPRAKATWQTSDVAVDAADVARELNGQLTTKMIVLEQLIAESQNQIERMEALLKRIEQARKDS